MPEKRKKGQHLTWENRQEIQLGLKNHLSFAKQLPTLLVVHRTPYPKK
ncbi:MAG: hypothetical protein ACLUNT_01610 [Eubacterium ventriosum]